MSAARAVAPPSHQSGGPGVSRVPESDVTKQDHAPESCHVGAVGSQLRITNIISKGHLNCKLDLNDVERKLPMAQYIPRRFSGLLLRILQPIKAHCQLYSNGKITINGGKSIRQNQALAKKFTDQLINAGYGCILSDFVVVNMVCSVDIQRKLPLEKIFPELRKHFPKIDYSPELFPGLSVRMTDCTAVLFHSGKINFLGCKALIDAEAAFIDLQLYL